MTDRLFKSAFRGKNVFVTGHTGFKGSWLSLWLHNLGASVTGYALEPPTAPSNFEACNIEDTLHRHHVGDIRNVDHLNAAVRDADPDIVLHLAAQSVVREGYRNPRETFDVNVTGTACVLDAVRKLGKPCVVICVTSDKCYENREQIWGYREDDPMGEHDPYGASKGAAELLIRCYRYSFLSPETYSQHGVKLASVRAGNVIGGGDWTEHALVVDLIKALTKGQPVELRSPNAYRPWQHVLQALGGYLTLASRLLTSDDPELCSGFNIGPLPGNELSVREVVETLIENWGYGSWKDVSDAKHPHESRLLYLAVDKARWALNWEPAWTVQTALAETARWYRHYLEEPATIREFSCDQIGKYEQTVAAAGGSPSAVESRPQSTTVGRGA